MSTPLRVSFPVFFSFKVTQLLPLSIDVGSNSYSMGYLYLDVAVVIFNSPYPRSIPRVRTFKIFSLHVLARARNRPAPIWVLNPSGPPFTARICTEHRLFLSLFFPIDLFVLFDILKEGLDFSRCMKKSRPLFGPGL